MFDSQTLVAPHPVLYKLGCNVCQVELFDILMYSSIICRYAKHNNNDHTLPMRRHAVCQLVPWRIPAHSFMGLGWEAAIITWPSEKVLQPSRSLPSLERSWRESDKSTSNNLVSWWCCVNRCRLVYPTSFSRAHLHTEREEEPPHSVPSHHHHHQVDSSQLLLVYSFHVDSDFSLGSCAVKSPLAFLGWLLMVGK